MEGSWGVSCSLLGSLLGVGWEGGGALRGLLRPPGAPPSGFYRSPACSSSGPSPVSESNPTQGPKPCQCRGPLGPLSGDGPRAKRRPRRFQDGPWDHQRLCIADIAVPRHPRCPPLPPPIFSSPSSPSVPSSSSRPPCQPWPAPLRSCVKTERVTRGCRPSSTPERQQRGFQRKRRLLLQPHLRRGLQGSGGRRSDAATTIRGPPPTMRSTMPPRAGDWGCLEREGGTAPPERLLLVLRPGGGGGAAFPCS